MTLHLRVPKYHCQTCRRYFRHPFVGIRPRYRASEAYRLEVYEARDGGVTLRKLSRTHQISAATVELVSASSGKKAIRDGQAGLPARVRH